MSTPTPVAAEFDRLAELWRSVPAGGALVVRWPSGDALVRPPVAVVAR